VRTECVPEKQRLNADRLKASTRRLLVAIVAVFLTLVAAFAYLCVRAPLPPTVPQVIGPDNTSVLGDAVLLSSELALCAGKIPNGSQVDGVDTNPVAVDVVRTVQINQASVFSLLHFRRSVSHKAPSLIALEDGEHAVILSSQGRWDGSLTRQTDGTFLPQPQLDLPEGAGVYSSSDRSGLFGISVRGPNGMIVMTVRDLKTRFPELNSALN
jgi:hypothetical protein